MALVFVRSTFTRFGGVPSLLAKPTSPLNSWKITALCQTQVAGLRATYGEPYPYAKPWPYETKNFNVLHEPFDYTEARINENSKVIVVDGNVAVGKKDFAKRLASDFDLKYIPPVDSSETFVLKGNGFDLRTLNDMLPESAKFYDLSMFFRDPHPEKGTVGKLLIPWHMEKFFTYAKALQHLFNTGQGVVIVKSVFTDSVFPEALAKLGCITPNFLKYFKFYQANTMCELLKPHVTIYLDAPTDVLMKRIKERNDPDEINCKFLNEKFLKNVERAYKEIVLPPLRESGEVLEIDWAEVADEMDMDVICEEMQRLDLDGVKYDFEDSKFMDWQLNEERMCHYRKVYADTDQLEALTNLELPLDCPEIMPNNEDHLIKHRVIDEHPAVKYAPGNAPEFGHRKLFGL